MIARAAWVSGRSSQAPAGRTDPSPLVAAAVGGDQRAWDALFRQFDPLVRWIARRFRLTPDQVDDAVQATWLRLVLHLHRLENPAAVGGWLVTTARRESLRVLQRATREVPTDQPIGHEEADPGSVAELDQFADDELRAAVRVALDSLPSRERALLDLLAREPPPSYDEIARVLGMAVGSIGPTRGRALAKLRRHPRLAQ